MVVWMLFAVPAILIFAGLGLASQAPRKFILGRFLHEFKEYERGVVYRFGKIYRIAEPGWQFVIPLIDSFVKYDLRTEAVDIPPQDVITKDAVKVTIDAVIYMNIEDPVKAEVKVEQDYRKAVEEYVKGRIRNLVGTLKLEELYSNISEINRILRQEVQKLVQEWGVVVSNIELVDVSPPDDIVKAMQAKEIAEYYKNAAAEESETVKMRINALEEAAGKLTQPTLNYLYLQSLKDIANGASNKIIFPLEFSKLVENLGTGSGIEQAADKILKKLN